MVKGKGRNIKLPDDVEDEIYSKESSNNGDDAELMKWYDREAAKDLAVCDDGDDCDDVQDSSESESEHDEEEKQEGKWGKHASNWYVVVGHVTIHVLSCLAVSVCMNIFANG